MAVSRYGKGFLFFTTGLLFQPRKRAAFRWRSPCTE
jgi:hypothetical protein